MIKILPVKDSLFPLKPNSSEKWYVFDLESNGLYDDVTEIFCIVLYDVVRKQTLTYGPDSIDDALALIADADCLIGHNIIFYDIPVIKKLFPSVLSKQQQILDTLICTRLIWPKEKLYDLDSDEYHKVPPGLRGSASLKAWGYRLSDYKIDFKDFSEYSQQMLDYCMAPHHKVLRDDLRWVESGSINVGDTILGFDEYGPNRRFKPTTVLAKTFDQAEIFEVTLKSGKKFHVTKEHRWLTSRARGGGGWLQGDWVETQNLRTDLDYCSKIPRFFIPWEEDTSKEAGWLAGMFDGEGCLSKHRVDFTIAQRPGITLNKLEKLLNTKYQKECVKRAVKKDSDCLTLRFTGNQYSKIEFLGKIRPERLINKFSFNQMGRMEIKQDCLVDSVVSIVSIGTGTIVKLTTDSATFILDGYPMHNCIQDVTVTNKLYEHITRQPIAPSAYNLEHQLATYIERQIRSGFPFDVDQCLDLVDALESRKETIEIKLKELFPPIEHEEWFTPKVNNAKRGYIKGQPFRKVRTEEFNPGSRQQIVQRLKDKYNWQPKDMTEKGNPVLNDDVLEKLPYPEAKPLSEYMLVNKRLSQIKDGKNGWLKLVKPTGTIHGDVITNGCITGRCSHRNPNTAQIPAGYSPYGKECRSLFHAPEGFTLIGCDAKALELRCLAGYLALWDQGEYANVVIDDSIDIHTYNQEKFGVETRDISKRLLYAVLYGAGHIKAGSIVDPNETNPDHLKRLGKQAIDSFFSGVPALQKLKKQLAETLVSRGHLIGLDRRPLYCRSDFKALNVLLQAAGAVIMKQVVINIHTAMEDAGFYYGHHWHQHGFIHDEVQLSCKQGLEQQVVPIILNAFPTAGQFFNFRCPIEGDAKTGYTWYSTH